MAEFKYMLEGYVITSDTPVENVIEQIRTEVHRRAEEE
jgi:hypothetical protein